VVRGEPRCVRNSSALREQVLADVLPLEVGRDAQRADPAAILEAPNLRPRATHLT
jgi:hypothetical protein